MYFAMDEIGFENSEKIKMIDSESDRWKFIYDIAKTYGFEGIHITPSLYKSFSLDLNNLPDYFHDFKLTFHFGGVQKITSENEYEVFDKELENGFKIALKHNMHDISIHPPFIYESTQTEKDICLEFFHKVISKWLKIAVQNGISLSLETHVSGEFYLFNGLNEYVKFIDIYPDLGILIDISHNYYDKYSEEEIIHILETKNIKGLHISDALQDVDFEKGTHLPIGKGTVNFSRLLHYFDKIPNIFGALEIKADNEGVSKSVKKLIDYTSILNCT